MNTARIKELAGGLGFEEIGITTPARLGAGEEAIARWVEEGRHGSMKYLEDFGARRARFFEDLPDAKSVLVLGVNYYSSAPHETGGGPFQGKVARYAWGLDYHEVIRRRHETLIKILQKEAGPGFRAKSCVDIQPLPERYAAVQAGLGFIGKHTGLLSKRFGPWLFLSEIVTNLELEESLPASGDCGTCSHCQSACPTGALDADYRIDARLCIAYLTIEHKGVIPRELRSKVGKWFFGCDACLAVCPFTSHSRETVWPELKASEGVGASLDVRELISLKTNRDAEKRFFGTSLTRANRKQMLRNACVVLGNSGDPAALPFLAEALGDEAPLVRLHAAWALGRIPTEGSRTLLQNRIPLEEDPETRKEILESLADLSKVVSYQPFTSNENP